VTRAARQHGLAGDDLQDLMQEVRIALWEHGLSAQVTDGWIFRVANFKVIDLLRRRSRERRHHQAIIKTVGGQPRDAELNHLLCVGVAALSPRLRQFFELRYRQALSEREISQRLQMCRSSVRWLDRSCRRQLMPPAISHTPLVPLAERRSSKG
jgi:RNA polymerase sigma factor (sigma-70 family)